MHLQLTLHFRFRCQVCAHLTGALNLNSKRFPTAG